MSKDQVRALLATWLHERVLAPMVAGISELGSSVDVSVVTGARFNRIENLGFSQVIEGGDLIAIREHSSEDLFWGRVEVGDEAFECALAMLGDGPGAITHRGSVFANQLGEWLSETALGWGTQFSPNAGAIADDETVPGNVPSSDS